MIDFLFDKEKINWILNLRHEIRSARIKFLEHFEDSKDIVKWNLLIILLFMFELIQFILTKKFHFHIL